jgi:hypothetical protein
MQKVVGSSPIIRFTDLPANEPFFEASWINEAVGPHAYGRQRRSLSSLTVVRLLWELSVALTTSRTGSDGDA